MTVQILEQGFQIEDLSRRRQAALATAKASNLTFATDRLRIVQKLPAAPQDLSGYAGPGEPVEKLQSKGLDGLRVDVREKIGKSDLKSAVLESDGARESGVRIEVDAATMKRRAGQLQETSAEQHLEVRQSSRVTIFHGGASRGSR